MTITFLRKECDVDQASPINAAEIYLMIRRREFIAGIGGAAAWPGAGRAQQRALPVVAFINVSVRPSATMPPNPFRAGLEAFGFVEGQNVSVEYHYLEGQYDRLPVLLADLVRRRVAVIAAGNPTVAVAAKTATATIPIVFGVAGDPVKLGLVASLARPGGNVTGVNFLVQEAVSKRLGLLHEMVLRPAAWPCSSIPKILDRQRSRCRRRRMPAA
jgi:putative tryptophan/tyrosine transport system substrate-binding protein